MSADNGILQRDLNDVPAAGGVSPNGNVTALSVDNSGNVNVNLVGGSANITIGSITLEPSGNATGNISVVVAGNATQFYAGNAADLFVTFSNNGNQTLYWGPAASVTTTNGMQLAAGGVQGISYTNTLFGITTGANTTVGLTRFEK